MGFRNLPAHVINSLDQAWDRYRTRRALMLYNAHRDHVKERIQTGKSQSATGRRDISRYINALPDVKRMDFYKYTVPLAATVAYCATRELAGEEPAKYVAATGLLATAGFITWNLLKNRRIEKQYQKRKAQAQEVRKFRSESTPQSPE
ncbi:MAG: hypothetical protein ABIH92_01770 [Nanoarchaeota archaeon]